MLYQVKIPPPKAKRLTERTLVIEYNGGFGGWDFGKDIYKLKKEDEVFIFEVPDKYEYIYTSQVCDGNYFDVVVLYNNDSGSRSEVVKLCPEPYDEGAANESESTG
jgi:hypothetical protein